QLGIALFERTNGGVRPTPAGRGFINGARRVLIELQIVIDGAKAVGRGDAGYLTIGFYTVTKRPRLTPPLLGGSIAWLADRRRDPTPINKNPPKPDLPQR